MLDFSEKVVVCTGSRGQLGQEINKVFKESNALVVGIDLLDTPSNDPNYFKVDTTVSSEVESLVQHIYSTYGRIDCLVNNAGVSTFEPFEKRREIDFDWVMNVNLKGTFNCIQAYVNIFDKYDQKVGNIINIGSIYGSISPDFRIYTDCLRKNSEVYGATKAGIIQMTKYFAAHLANRGIRVNCVSPGGIFNPKDPQGQDFIQQYSSRVPMQRMGNVEEMIGAIQYFAHECSSYTTGQNLVVDGGMSCW